MSEQKDNLLTINEWLDAIGCDRAYKKDMKETYQKAIPELKAQMIKDKKQIVVELASHYFGSLSDGRDLFAFTQAELKALRGRI